MMVVLRDRFSLVHLAEKTSHARYLALGAPVDLLEVDRARLRAELAGTCTTGRATLISEERTAMNILAR
jgi:hypothetical protein